MSDYANLDHETVAAILAKEMMISFISRIKEGSGLEHPSEEVSLRTKGNIESAYTSLHGVILKSLKPT